MPEEVVEDVSVVEVLRRLRGSSLFDGLTLGALEDLAAAFDETALPTGATLTAGGTGSGLAILEAGRLRVAVPDADGAPVVLGDVHSGEDLGDAALLSLVDGATVTALTASRVLTLPQQRVDAFLAAHPDAVAVVQAVQQRCWEATSAASAGPGGEVTRAALACFFGDRVPPETLAALAGDVDVLSACAGTVLFSEDLEADCVWIVVSGRVALSRRRHDGSEMRVGEVGPGGSVGETAALSNESQLLSATVLADADLLRLSRTRLDRLLEEHPAALRAFMGPLIEQLHASLRGRSLVTQARFRALATADECQEIVRTADVVLRNLRITQMYHRLSLEMAALIGGQDANWCTFACNASKTAGYSIRGEGVPLVALVDAMRRDLRLARAFDRVTTTLSASTVGQIVEAALGEVGRIVSAGNLTVFAELAPVFADFTRTFHEDPVPDRAKLERFLGLLTPGATEDGGQDTLASALRHYYTAAFEVSPKSRAELMLIGNIEVSLHEQTRLQDYIAAAMDAPLQVTIARLLGPAAADIDLASRTRTLPARVGRRVGLTVRQEEEASIRWLAARWRRRVTRSLMTLRLPYGSIRLGADMPRLPDERLYPDVLQRLELPELVAFVARYDSDPLTTDRSRAVDWADLGQRMCFVLELMRSRQQSLELFSQPFLLDQRTLMAGGVVPSGNL